MEKDLKKLRAKRSTLKIGLTRIENFVNDADALASAGARVLQSRINKLNSIYEQYEEVNSDILSWDEEDQEDISILEEKYYVLLSVLQNSLLSFTKTDSTTRTTWLPFDLLNGKPYIENTLRSLRLAHFTDETLYPEWCSSTYESFTQEEITKYLPTLEKSCRVKVNGNAFSYDRFQGQITGKVYSMFLGGGVQCISWAPTREDMAGDASGYLAAATHGGADLPRIGYDELASGPGMLQLWLVSFYSFVPKIALGLLHDYGTVWSMAWCPSGAREVFEKEKKKFTRLGLLAIACSNGSAYILSVPFPDTVVKREEKLFVKLKPVAELRFGMNSSRKKYQATSISWSKKREHAVIIVGYSDGSIALYDLLNESPFLRSTEKGVIIFYPYHDERIVNSCVSGVDIFPGRCENVSDCVSAGSPTGGVAALGGARGRGAARAGAHQPAAAVMFAPGWPSASLVCDDGYVNQSANELEWHGFPRRLGPLRATVGCDHCGRVVQVSPPILRTTRLFPPCKELKKKNVASINLIPLGAKRKHLMDELSTKVEPLTYEEAIEKYALELVISGRNVVKGGNGPKELYPERFPLADVTSMAYCPLLSHHEMLAVATHSGVIFIFKAL